MTKGKIIALEGPEGCGKTTTALLLRQELENQGYRVMIGREPGGTNIGEKIRSLIIRDDMEAKTELLLFLAARYEHYMKVIKPFISSGGIFICDRYIPSSIAIQGYAKELGDIVKCVHNIIMPPNALNYTMVFIDIPVELGLSRKFAQEDGVNKFEMEGLEFHLKVYDGYQKILSNPDFNTIKVDGMKLPLDIVKDIFNSIKF